MDDNIRVYIVTTTEYLMTHSYYTQRLTNTDHGTSAMFSEVIKIIYLDWQNFTKIDRKKLLSYKVIVMLDEIDQMLKD